MFPNVEICTAKLRKKAEYNNKCLMYNSEATATLNGVLAGDVERLEYQNDQK